MPRWVLVWAVVVAASGGVTGNASASPAELRGASIREAGEVEVWLDVSAPAVPFARELAGTPGLEPTRLYFDLRDTVLSQQAVRDITGKGAVRRVRLGQNDPKTTRVVIELSSPRPFALERRSKAVVIRFAPAPMAVASLPREAPGRATDWPLRDEEARPDATARAARPPVAPTSSPASAAPPVRLAVARAPLAPTAPRAFEKRALEPASTADAALEERVARLQRRRDWPGLLVLYASAGSPVGEAAPARVRAAVADALLAVGLPERADDVLGVPSRTEAGVVRLARAEVALARGDGRALRALLASLDGAELSAADARRLGRLRIRAALAEGQSADAADLDAGWTAGLRRALARSTIETAEAAAAVGAFEQAAAAFRRARDASDAPALRAAAASGMLRAAMELGDDEAVAQALRSLASEERTPMAQSVARSLATRSGVTLDEPRDEGSR